MKQHRIFILACSLVSHAFSASTPPQESSIFSAPHETGKTKAAQVLASVIGIDYAHSAAATNSLVSHAFSASTPPQESSIFSAPHETGKTKAAQVLASVIGIDYAHSAAATNQTDEVEGLERTTDSRRIAADIDLVKRYLTTPDLITETSRPTSAHEWLTHTPGIAKVAGHTAILPDITKELSDLLEKTALVFANGVSPKNVLFCGPGLGKIGLTRKLAQESGVDYAVLSGAKFAALSRNPDLAIQELKKVVAWAEMASMIILVNEAEDFVPQGDTTLKSLLFTKAFFEVIRSSNNKLMWIFATDYYSYDYHFKVLYKAIGSYIDSWFEFKLQQKSLS